MRPDSPAGALITGALAGHYQLSAPILAKHARGREITAARIRAQNAIPDLGREINTAVGSVAQGLVDGKTMPATISVRPVSEARRVHAEAQDELVILQRGEVLADATLTTTIKTQAEAIRGSLRKALGDVLDSVRPVAELDVPWTDAARAIGATSDIRDAWSLVTLAVPKYDAIRHAVQALCRVTGDTAPPEFPADPGRLAQDPRARLVAVANLPADAGPWVPDAAAYRRVLAERAEERRERNAMIRAGHFGAVVPTT